MNNGDKPADTYVTSEIRKGQRYSVVIEGLTKREYFAGSAMQGLCASNPNITRDCDSLTIALLAVGVADELLEALENNND